MTSLNIIEATEGADATGLEDLYGSIHQKFRNTYNRVDDGAHEVTAALKECWSGEDEEKFEENFMNFIKQVKNAIDSYDKAIKYEFIEVFNQWVEFQKTNVK